MRADGQVRVAGGQWSPGHQAVPRCGRRDPDRLHPELVESIKELEPDRPIVMLRKSDAQLLLEVSAHKQRPSLCPFKYTNEND
jgi:hypothetical protein